MKTIAKNLAGFVAVLTLAACATTETAAVNETASVDAPKPVAAAPAQNVEVKEVGEDGSRIICKRVQVVGSKFNKKTCATALEWEERRKAAMENTKEMQSKGRGWEPSGG